MQSLVFWFTLFRSKFSTYITLGLLQGKNVFKNVDLEIKKNKILRMRLKADRISTTLEFMYQWYIAPQFFMWFIITSYVLFRFKHRFIVLPCNEEWILSGCFRTPTSEDLSKISRLSKSNSWPVLRTCSKTLESGFFEA